MAAALECWSSRNSTDEDMVEQVLMKTHDRSEGVPSSSFPTGVGKESSSLMQKKLQKLSRNVSEAITNLKNSLNLDSIRDPPTGRNQSNRKLMWGSVIRNLTLLYPGSQLPEKLVCNVRKHFDSLPLSYALAGFEMEDVFLHIRLIEQATEEDHPAIFIQEVSDDGTHGSVFKLTFACNSLISWPAMSGTLDSASICCKKIQIFEKKGFTLGIILVLVQSGQEKSFKTRIENSLKSALKKPKPTTMKLPFGLCGRQEENSRDREIGEINDLIDGQEYENGIEKSNPKAQLQTPLPVSSIVVSVDEWQTISSGQDEIGKWLLNSDQIEFMGQIGPNLFKGVYKGKRVTFEKLRGCEKGMPYEFELRRDLLELMSFGQKNILQFYGVFIEDIHGLCVVTKMMEGGSVYEIIQKKKKLQIKEIFRISTDVAAALKFMNDHGLAYRDLNTQRILLDRQGHACVGNMGIITVCKNNSEVTEYETDGYRWLAPEIIAGDPESVTETWMSNVYSFGMVVWEMVTGEAAYAAYSPVQAAVGIAACGLRPEIPKDCPQLLRSLMVKCWDSCPSKRPPFSEILRLLLRFSYNNSR
ncbi:Protein kinase domain [Macleaya cordata]|uniref:Protein kinase domain n=1 Tax=Macleaya cordata TaxID=56857 RepID=A0A200PLR9_MACCD|nr:Protein kinase domain [Macleaya cordata]